MIVTNFFAKSLSIKWSLCLLFPLQIVKIFSEDGVGKVVEIPADMMARDLCQLLVYKSHCLDDNSWVLVEHHPLLGLGKWLRLGGPDMLFKHPSTHTNGHLHTHLLVQTMAGCGVGRDMQYSRRLAQVCTHACMHALHTWVDDMVGAYSHAGMSAWGHCVAQACTEPEHLMIQPRTTRWLWRRALIYVLTSKLFRGS